MLGRQLTSLSLSFTLYKAEVGRPTLGFKKNVIFVPKTHLTKACDAWGRVDTPWQL